jgi:plasmid maintenance system antidote protein VapI
MGPLEALTALVKQHGPSEAARRLGVERTTVYNVLRGYTGMSDSLAGKLGYVKHWVPIEAVKINVGKK